MLTETYDDLAILECYDYLCGYCSRWLPVYGDVAAYRDDTHKTDATCIVDNVCELKRVYFGFHFDHLEPRSAGGTDEWFNLVPCCKACNSRKNRSSLPRWLFRQVDPSCQRRAVYALGYRARQVARAELCELAATQDLEGLLLASLA